MKNMTIEQFAMQTASNEPVPGGGSISALAGALAAALTEMVAGLTIGKKKYAEVEEEKAARTEAMQNGLKAAVAVPLSVAKAAYEVLPYAETMVTKGNKTAVTDALVATMMARTAVLGALFNVKINLESIKDEEFVKATSEEVAVLEKKAIAFEQKILAQAGVSKSVVE